MAKKNLSAQRRKAARTLSNVEPAVTQQQRRPTKGRRATTTLTTTALSSATGEPVGKLEEGAAGSLGTDLSDRNLDADTCMPTAHLADKQQEAESEDDVAVEAEPTREDKEEAKPEEDIELANHKELAGAFIEQVAELGPLAAELSIGGHHDKARQNKKQKWKLKAAEGDWEHSSRKYWKPFTAKYDERNFKEDRRPVDEKKLKEGEEAERTMGDNVLHQVDGVKGENKTKVEKMGKENNAGDLGAEKVSLEARQPLPQMGLSVKHPLNNSWTFWYFREEKNRRWEDCQMKVLDVATVEDFWAVYNHIAKVRDLTAKSDYSLFRKGIYPCWDDFNNMRGGRWIFNLESKKGAELVDTLWLDVMLLLIGETDLQLSEQLNGAVVNVRYKQVYRIGIWVADAAKSSGRDLEVALRDKLGLGDKVRFQFSTHKEARAS